LRLDRSPIAFYFGLEQQRILYLLKGGFDPAYARFSPGMLLMERLIARAFEGGLDRIELLGGNEPHKLRWTSSSHERLSLQSFARSPVRTAQWAALAYARPLALRVGLDRAFRAARDRARVALTAVRAGRS
jgi:CelD/BcsL family acetyltransferase involved in cellulose biosynthesis